MDRKMVGFEGILRGAFQAAITAGLIFTLLLAGYIHVKNAGGFGELYFTGWKDLPEQLKEDMPYNLSFKITNKGDKVKEYTYVIEYDGKIEDRIMLQPGEETTVLYEIKNTGKNWVVNHSNTIEQRKTYSLREANLSDTLSTNISYFTGGLHSKITIDELREKPYTKIRQDEYLGLEVRRYFFENYTLSVDKEKLVVDRIEVRRMELNAKKPVVVTIYEKEPGKEMRVYFSQRVS
jgi:hypothetical protein